MKEEIRKILEKYLGIDDDTFEDISKCGNALNDLFQKQLEVESSKIEKLKRVYEKEDWIV